jgi:hypothetical protein
VFAGFKNGEKCVFFNAAANSSAVFQYNEKNRLFFESR